ncbi:MAG: PDZ domain-containing protein, partial [Lachnospiraceae bacterium]|nr:PDZ domain-containing protein [Lachnospiraceae bacterium]
MNDKTWEKTGKGQYELRNTPVSYNNMPIPRQKSSHPLLPFVLGFAVGIILVLSIYFATFRFSNSLSLETQKKIGTLESVIDKYYMGERETASEADGIYKGIVSSLGDKYAAYYTQEELTRSREDSAGEFSGIGCTIGMDEEVGVCYIASIMEGYSADQAGLKEGDYFLEVNGEDATEWNAEEVANHVKGETGTSVEIKVLRDSEELSFTLKRVKVEVKTVESRMEDEKNKIGYIRIEEFDEITVSQFKEAKE